jgi:hypothetical protein
VTLEPGTKATLTGMGGGPCEVVRVVHEVLDIDGRRKVSRVRVRMSDTGTARTVDPGRLRITPEPTALGGDYVPEPDPISEAMLRVSQDWRSRPRPTKLTDLHIPELDGQVLRVDPPRPVRQREPRLESPRYLAYVRRHACCHCGAPGPSEAHHWSHHGGSMGAKCDDFRTVPLCTGCHRHWHDHGTLAGLDRVASETLFVETQNALLATWIASVPMRKGRHAEVIDALVEAMRKMEVK